MGSEVARQSREEVAQQAKFFQPTQPNPKPIRDRSGQLANKHEFLLIKAKHSGVQRSRRNLLPGLERSRRHFLTENCVLKIDQGNLNITPSVIKAQTNLSEEIRVEHTHDRSGQPDKHGIALRATPEVHREIMTLNTDNELIRESVEEDMDFKIPGLPHSIVKQLHSASVRELIQKIENHPNRHALQRDLQQRQQLNPFNEKSKQMIHEIENVELCESLDTEPQTQCKVCLSYWNIGIVYCTCGHFLRK